METKINIGRHFTLRGLWLVVIALISVAIYSCGDNDRDLDENTVLRLTIDDKDVSTVEIVYGASSFMLGIEASSDWTVKTLSDWCTLSNSSGSGNTKTFIKISVSANTGGQREASLIFKAGSITKEVIIVQSGRENFARPSGMTKNAMELMAAIRTGWNLGNNLEATRQSPEDAKQDIDPITGSGETAWGNPVVTPELIRKVKSLGFNAIRIPTAWSMYCDADNNIDDRWMNRVQQVVDYCVNENLYTIINIHWDGGWLEKSCGKGMTESEITKVEQKQRKLWKQIASKFRDYDEHLIFAGTNEPDAQDARQMETLLRYEQAFVDEVRATGGNNQYRCLIVQGPCTDAERTNQYMKMPNDPTPESLVVEFHYYTPYHYCQVDVTSKDCTYFWGQKYKEYGIDTYGQEDFLTTQLDNFKTNFIDKGIPVIMGEYGYIIKRHPDSSLQKLSEESRVYYTYTVVNETKKRGIPAFFWDNDENGIINRKTLEEKHTDLIQAMMDASK